MTEQTEEIIKPKKPRITRNRELLTTQMPVVGRIQVKEPIVLRLAEIAEQLNVRLYSVGGYIRDYYLNRVRADLDFTVVGDAIAFAEEVAKRFKSKAVVYEKFRTALVPAGDFKLEFVGTRKEEYNPESRKPIVKEGTLEDDLRRRDFTINAMAVSLNENNFGEVVDLFNGKKDLEDKILRTPLDPEITFSDDPLRMMRAARFASQLGFRIEENTLEAIKLMADRIRIISKERVSDEFLKILASPRPSIGINILFQTGLLTLFFPEIEKLSGVEIVEEASKTYAHKDVYLHSLKVLDNIAKVTDNVWLRFAALVHDIGKPQTKHYNPNTGWSFHGHEELGARIIEKLFRRMKLPMEKAEYVEKLVRLHQRPMVLVDDGVTDSAVRRLAFRAGAELEDLFLLCRSDITTKNPNLSEKYLNNYDIVMQKVIEVQEKDKLREFQSPVRGDEIMEICDLPPSRIIGFIKGEIEEAILDGIIPNDYKPARAYFLEHRQDWIEQYNKAGKKTK